MQMSGEHRIPAPRSVVWEALHDPEILKDCIKGCQRLEKKSDHELEATVQAKVGPVKATFEAEVEIVDPVAPERYTLRGEGKGGVAGFAKGQAEVFLAEDGTDTILTYNTDVKVGGKLAQLGSRLVDTTAKKYAAEFFQTLSDKLSGPAPAGEEPMGLDPVGEGTPVAAATGRVEPSAAASEVDEAAHTATVGAPRPEDRAGADLEVAAGKRVWGGPWFWGILAFAAALLVLIALQ
ncbi:CoxG family protein [Acuticoccus sp.]|uniref:CoxG family protein n=1 Tax=Acuticoccus sp. TaxID=1904378 RepID=UPI003B51C718